MQLLSRPLEVTYSSNKPVDRICLNVQPMVTFFWEGGQFHCLEADYTLPKLLLHLILFYIFKKKESKWTGSMLFI